jgi:hypothetical protein
MKEGKDSHCSRSVPRPGSRPSHYAPAGSHETRAVRAREGDPYGEQLRKEGGRSVGRTLRKGGPSGWKRRSHDSETRNG